MSEKLRTFFTKKNKKKSAIFLAGWKKILEILPLCLEYYRTVVTLRTIKFENIDGLWSFLYIEPNQKIDHK